MISLTVIKDDLQLVGRIFLTLFIFYFAGCGAVPTSGRYETDDKVKESTEKNDKNTETISESDAEFFDLKPYHPELKLDDTEFNTDNYSDLSDAWFEYNSNGESAKDKKIVGTKDGFRVQIIATDDIDDANKMNTEVAQLFPNHRTYVNFEPPFYKVKVGDFDENSLADDMRFKLRQMGYSESKVVRETINVFE